MAYITAIFDRTQADIAAKNSKSYLNVVDWSRIYSNSLEVNTLLATEIYTLDFNALSIPTTEDIFTISQVNIMLANIERMRLWASIYLSAYITDPLFVEIKDDWLPGQNNLAPNYNDVNSWEKVLDLLHDYLDPFVPPVVSGNWEFLSGDWQLVAGGYLEHV